MNNEDSTKDKILLAALTLFSEQGIKKTGMAEVAYRAGVTRITVYRYFADKEELVREAFLRVEQVFQNGLAELEQNPEADWESVLSQIGEGLSALPAGDVFARFDEIKRLYPDAYQSIQDVRVATLTGIFEHLFALAERQDLLRPGLSRPVVQAIFWEFIINFFDNPRFTSLGLSDAELYDVVTGIFLHGIFKNQPEQAVMEALS
jgi:AcrR family transcriptional regulator